jgi:hypothetical protein
LLILREWEKRTANQPGEGLRPRRCLNPECNAVFALCCCCDRGQRYCRPICRQQVRRLQVLAAGRRYCRRQQSFRRCESQADMTHQGPLQFVTPQPPHGSALTQCGICGQATASITRFTGYRLGGYALGEAAARPMSRILSLIAPRPISRLTPLFCRN